MTRKHLPPRLLRPSTSLVAALLLAVGACGDAPEPEASADDAAAQAEAPAPDLTDAQRAAAVERGEAAAGQLAGSLGSTLQREIQSGGVVSAVEFCNLEALPITARVTEELGVEVARTADRVRNPANAPDAVDERALDAFAGTSAGEVPHHLEPMGDSAVRYYKPLYAAGLCVQCHGPVETLDPALLEVLREEYPRDEATGYEEGDFRGVIRVTLPRDELGAAGP